MVDSFEIEGALKLGGLPSGALSAGLLAQLCVIVQAAAGLQEAAIKLRELWNFSDDTFSVGAACCTGLRPNP